MSPTTGSEASLGESTSRLLCTEKGHALTEPEIALSAEAIAALTGTFGVPDVALPWIDRFLEADEIELVVALGTGPLSLAETAARLPRWVTPSFFARAVRRGIANQPTPEVVALADFSDRFDIWALFEGWKDIPDPVRARLTDWALDRYVAEKRSQIEMLKAGTQPQPKLENAEYLLLHEAEALLARVEHIYLWPCDCRAIAGRCSKPANVCLCFQNARGLGWEISLERALEVLREADRAGLMHTSETQAESVQPAEPGAATQAEAYAGTAQAVSPTSRITSGALCNCCSDCCFPQLASERLGATKLWPRSRYVATFDRDSCTACGRCTKRCPFGVFAWREHATRGARASRQAADLVMDVERCRGCGLCATACPADSIVMQPLPAMRI